MTFWADGLWATDLLADELFIGLGGTGGPPAAPVAPSSVVTDLRARSLRYVHMVELQFDGGTERLHNGIGQIEYDGNIWTGAGLLGEVGDILESVSVIPEELTLTLSGANQALLDAADAETIINRPMTVLFGLLDQQNRFTGNWPRIRYEGLMSHFIQIDGDQTSLQLVSRHRLDKQPNYKRFTDEDHQVDYPGDEFFSLVPNIQTKQVSWGDTRDFSGGQQIGGLRSPNRLED